MTHLPSPFDRSRADWYPTSTHNGVTFRPGVVLSSSGRPRPELPLPLSVMTIHYVGGGRFLDPADTADELANIERYAQSVSKPNEYNSASDSEAVTWEYAGPHRAAHSGGENMSAWGHLAMLGLEAPSNAQADRLIDGIRRARRQLVDAGMLSPDHVVLAHLQMPGAATACPGPLYANQNWWGRIVAPLEEEDDMQGFLWKHVSKPGMFWVAGGSVVHVDAELRDKLRAAGVDVIRSPNTEVWASYTRVARGIDPGGA